MDKTNYNWLKNLLYNDDTEEIIKEVENIDCPQLLHIIAANYNWDRGLDVPAVIINNTKCDLGTALMLFYDADGYRFLTSKDSFSLITDEKWKEFILNLYNQIVNGEFSECISYEPPLTKVQRYKLKKENPAIQNIFLEKTPGKELEVP